VAKAKYPKGRRTSGDEAAYVSWENEAERTVALAAYTQSIQESATATFSSRSRNFKDMTGYLSGRPGLREADFNWFRPDQAVPDSPKEIIAFARLAYRRIGLIRNAIDLMGDFACQGVRLVHQNHRVEKFYNDWFARVKGKEVSERLCNLLLREANVPIRMKTAKVNKAKRLQMQQSLASPDMNAVLKTDDFQKGEIPWQYNFLDPLTVEVVGGPVATLSGKKRQYAIILPRRLAQHIRQLQNSQDSVERSIVAELPDEILDAAIGSKKVLLPPDKTFVYHYKKDDWQEWADPMTFSCFNDLILYDRLKLADKAALDGAISKIRVWKLGSLEHKLAPTPTASSTLQEILGSNVGGGTIDMVWGPDIELIETGTDVQRFLGEEKYRPTLMAIYACLGIPPTLTGTFGASGTTNNFISLKTLTERLNYIRGIVLEFWNEQLNIVKKSMGFRFPAQVEFDYMYLDDPAAMINLLVGMADRNILSDEFVQRHIKAKPEMERRRVAEEEKRRVAKDMEKISPYHSVDKQYGLEKIALQTGVVSPTQVGVELQEKNGDQSALEMRNKQARKSAPKAQTPQAPGTPGRPPNTRDQNGRKPRTFKPRNKAAIELWAKDAQAKIAKVLNPGLLSHFNKKNMRSLTAKEFEQTEDMKFEVLCNLECLQDLADENVLSGLDEKLSDGVHRECREWIDSASENIQRKLSIEEIRGIRASFYADYKTR
jgi:hypothetical protein